jgi:hypothetical protein
MLYILNVKDRPLPNIPFYAIVSQLPDDGEKIGRNMSGCINYNKITTFQKMALLSSSGDGRGDTYSDVSFLTELISITGQAQPVEFVQ